MTALLLHLLKTPGLTGAFTPSSRYLASAMVRAAGEVNHVVELGAGTGPVTKALRSRLPNASLVVVEIQPRLAQRLRTDFGGLDVRQNSAHEVLDDLVFPAPAAVVSSLPFRSLPQALRELTVGRPGVAQCTAGGGVGLAAPFMRARGTLMHPLNLNKAFTLMESGQVVRR